MIQNTSFAFAASSTLIVSIFLGLLLSLLIGQIVQGISSRAMLVSVIHGATALRLLIIAIVLSASA